MNKRNRSKSDFEAGSFQYMTDASASAMIPCGGTMT